MKKNKSKKNIILILCSIIVVGIILVIDLILLDCKYKNFNFKIDIVLTIITLLFSSITAYMLFLKERFATKNYDINKYSNMAKSFLILFIFGFIIKIFEKYFLLIEILYLLFTLAYLIYSSVNLLNTIRHNEIKRIISQTSEIIFKNLTEMNKTTVKQIRKYLYEINEIYKNEYYNKSIFYCRYIIDEYIGIIEKYLIEINELKINKKSEDDEILKEILFYYNKLIINDLNDSSLYLNNYCISKFKIIVEYVVKCELYDTFKYILKEYVLCVKDYAKYLDIDHCVKNLFFILKNLYDRQQINLFKMVNDEVIHIYRLLEVVYNQKNTLLIYKYFSNVFNNLNLVYDKYFEIIFESFESIIISNMVMENVDEMLMCFGNIFETELYKDKRVKKNFYDLIKKIIEVHKLKNDNMFIYWLHNFLIKDNDLSLEEVEQIREMCSYNILNNNDEIPPFILPNYIEILKKNLYDEFLNKDNSYKLMRLLSKCVLNGSKNTVIRILDNLENILKMYKCTDVKHQIIWFNVYFDLLKNKSIFQDGNFFKIILYRFEDTIIELDKNKSISKDLGFYLLGVLRDFASINLINNEIFTNGIVDLLDSFLDEDKNLNFVNCNVDVEKKIYKSLFYLSVSAIESGDEFVISKISNIFGWKIKNKIEKGHDSLANILIDYTLRLFELSYQNKLNEQVIVFQGTLFIIIGAFSLIDKKHEKFADRIIETVGKEEYRGLLERSRELRICIADDWNDILNNEAKTMIHTFWKKMFSK